MALETFSNLFFFFKELKIPDSRSHIARFGIKTEKTTKPNINFDVTNKSKA